MATSYSDNGNGGPDSRSANDTVYTKLRLDSRSIRLIRLLPETTPNIHCELYETTLQEAKDSYAALSYTWAEGSTPAAERAIYCNGSVMRVSANLCAALLQLQQQSRPVVLWVDALCINQADDAERTHQVGMMRDIYTNSRVVVIWLGIRGRMDDLGEAILDRSIPSRDVADDEEGEEGFGRRVNFYGDERDLGKLDGYLYQLTSGLRTLGPETRDIYGAFCVVSMLSQGVPASNLWYLRHLDHSPPIIRGLVAILAKSWWRRIWVVQETVVAQKATVFYGDISIPWDAFSKAAHFYDTGRVSENLGSVSYLTYGDTLTDFCRVINEVETTRRDWKKIQPIALLPTLRKFRAREASDRRDKVFALLGLVRSWGQEGPMLPEYGCHIWSAFLKTTIRLISGTKSLAVLAGTLGKHGEAGRHPSWITDWSCPPEVNEYDRLNNLFLYNASGGIVQRVRLHGSTLLETKGYLVDRVVLVGRGSQEIGAGAVQKYSGLKAAVAEWSRHFEWSDNDEYVLGGGLRDAFWRTICGDTIYIPEEESKEESEEESEEENETEATVGRVRGRFRRAHTGDVRLYRNWRKVDPSDNRRTSIIGGIVQESSAMDRDQQGDNGFQLAAERASGSRKFFMTRKGYIGTGPRSLKVGDGVFILLGSRVPIILRTSPDAKRCRDKRTRELVTPPEEENARIDLTDTTARLPKREPSRISRCSEDHPVCYKVVGDAYVHGIMDGQLVWEDQERGMLREPETVYLT